MGVMSVCSEGYQIRACRCPKKHDPVEVKDCYPGHLHNGLYTDSGPGAAKAAAPVSAPVSDLKLARDLAVAFGKEEREWTYAKELGVEIATDYTDEQIADRSATVLTGSGNDRMMRILSFKEIVDKLREMGALR